MSTKFSLPSLNSARSNKPPTMSILPPKEWSEIKKANADKGCLVSRTLDQLGGADQGLRSILNFFLSACESLEFTDKCNQLGLREGAFAPVDLSPHHPCYNKFSQALTALPGDAQLGVVFHGTAEQHIDSIVCDGLDPKRRSGQTYGPGEYFATNPQISVGYCRGGTEMFVFLVVVPKRDSGTRAPANFVVVNNNSHQIPLGTMFFDSVDQGVVVAAQKLKEKLNQLAQDAEAKLLEVAETKIKAAIMQELMKNELEKASHLYLENKAILTDLSKREIAWYAHPFLKNDSRFATFFPDLPNPLKATELKDANVTSLEMSEQMESRAKRNLDRTCVLFTKKTELQQKKAAESKGSNTTESLCEDSDTEEEQAVAIKRTPKPPAILASILHNMTNNRVDVASELYNEKAHILDGFAKREIAQCVRRNIDDPELVPVLFPDLPNPDLPDAPPSKKPKDAVIY